MSYKPPSEFNLSNLEEWPQWRDRFRLATKLNKQNGEIQVSSMLYAMGIQAESIFARLSFDEEHDKNDFDKVLEKFNDYFLPKTNVIHIRAMFHRRTQSKNETIEEYMRELYKLAENAGFENKDEAIRDRLVVGILDAELSEKLQMQPDLNLQKAITIARQHEKVKKEIEQQRGTNLEEEIDRMMVKDKFPFQRKPATFPSCGRCGRNHEKYKCPAQGHQCWKCEKFSHFARFCKSKPSSNRVNIESLKQSERHGTYLINQITSKQNASWKVEIQNSIKE